MYRELKGELSKGIDFIKGNYINEKTRRMAVLIKIHNCFSYINPTYDVCATWLKLALFHEMSPFN